MIELIGWIGSIFVVWAYAALSLNKVSSTSIYYKLANLFGALLLTIFTLSKEAYPPATVNAIWTILAIISLIKMKK